MEGKFQDLVLFEKEGESPYTFADLLKEIYGNASANRKQIRGMFDLLSQMVRNPAEATMLMPVLGEFMEAAVKNDDNLIKMASLVSKALPKAEKVSDGGILTDEEKRQLLEDAEINLRSRKTGAKKDIGL
jgi:c-di-GMP-related signal transduction protein